ncbi:helix-turn-helix transcriptional regulator [Pseudomonas aeruginosa]|nr:helix-turn-helix transcriptional regulator [Pseudomonas aeruginosa]
MAAGVVRSAHRRGDPGDPRRAGQSLDGRAPGRRSGTSRSTLALRFKQTAGLAPLEYVSHWRMQLAARALRDSKATISSIAQTLGYGSDSAFSNAFKRIMKCSPRDYRSRQASRA